MALARVRRRLAMLIAVGGAVAAACGGGGRGGTNDPERHRTLWAGGWVRDFTSPQQGVLLRSRDSGASWDVVATLEDEGVQRVQFLDPSRGWILAGNAPLRSDDGGRSWVRQPLPGRQLDLFFLSGDQGVVVGIGPRADPFSFQAPALIFETTDGGGMWRESALPSAALEPAFEGVHFVCLRTDGVGVAGGRLPMLRTGDGGVTWQAVDALSFHAATATGCAVHPSAALFVTARGPGLFRSDDGGRTWSDATSLLPREIFPGELLDIAFTNEGTGIAVGTVALHGVDPDDSPEVPDPVVIATRDVSTPWTRQTLPSQSGVVLDVVAAAGDPALVVVSGEPSPAALEERVPFVFRTIDGGASWEPVVFPDVVGQIDDVQIIGE